MDTILELLKRPQWQDAIKERVSEQLLSRLTEFLNQELNGGKTIYPEQKQWFRALNELSPEQVRVVILGQDPYHGPNQAQGLSFSVPDGMKCPPSLRNIFKELKADLVIDNQCLDLSKWLEQGVLLLNAVLTVEHKKAGSHAKKGWEEITDAIISHISAENQNVVFLLWGGYAQKKQSLIDENKHCVLTATHPSPLSAHRGWFGCQHFSKANAYLSAQGYAEINWQTSTAAQASLF